MVDDVVVVDKEVVVMEVADEGVVVMEVADLVVVAVVEGWRYCGRLVDG